MKPKLNFGCLPTIIGSMPHKDPHAACRQVLKYLPQVPAWPQLPSLSALENQYLQSSEGFPGLSDREPGLRIDRSAFELHLEGLYQAYLSGDHNKYPVSPKYAAGLHAFISLGSRTDCACVKGQMTGPISWGLSLTQADGKPGIYDDTIADAMARFLRLKAAWQEQLLRELCPRTMIFVDEPSLAYMGSAFVSLSKEKVLKLLNEVLGGISGVRGVHCCSNTDWPILFESATDVVSFDAYGFAASFALYPTEVAAFLKRGGSIAWGIVPNNQHDLTKETVNSLRDRLEEAMAPFTRKDVPFRQLLEQALLTPSCGLASLSTEQSATAMQLLADLSAHVRRKYSL